MIILDQVLRNPLVADTLANAGWTTDRAVDSDHWAAWLAAEGYAENNDVHQILQSFGRLTVIPPQHPDAVFSSGALRFEPDLAWSGERNGVVERERQLRLRLWPIAEWSDTYMLLYADNGAVYADGANLGVLLVGETFVEALILMITAEREPILVIE